MFILFEWLISALAILVSAYILPGVHVASFVTALVAAVVLGIVNAILKPILILLSLPITVLTLGLFTLVIDALLILLTSAIVPGFKVDGFWWAFLFSLVLSVVNSFLHQLSRTSNWS
jgi:putative membrane protein